ncbi:MAG: helix-turn-helix transcriptional regulator [Treponema sp.]|nr:helix-turn-helix transcriptional regulator [Treponema sp.]
MSQLKLAELCGTSTSYIGEIEIGKKFPSVEMIQRFSEAINIQPHMLFMTETDSYSETNDKEKKEKMIEKLQTAIREIVESA